MNDFAPAVSLLAAPVNLGIGAEEDGDSEGAPEGATQELPPGAILLPAGAMLLPSRQPVGINDPVGVGEDIGMTSTFRVS